MNIIIIDMWRHGNRKANIMFIDGHVNGHDPCTLDKRQEPEIVLKIDIFLLWMKSLSKNIVPWRCYYDKENYSSMQV